jgi:Zn-dependent protease
VYNPDPYRPPVSYYGYGGPSRRRGGVGGLLRQVNWEIVAVFIILFGFFVFVLTRNDDRWLVPGTIGLVVVGWVFSLCLHEYAHAATAYLGGDNSDSTASYLTFNPLKYVHPVLSILLPLAFILIGGIALPGGAVYLRRDLVRSRGWQSAISLAGPAMNLLVAALLAIPFVLGVADNYPALRAALALLAFFQVAAVILNLLPIPPLDGFNAIAPFLSYNTRVSLQSLGSYTFILIFFALSFIPQLNEAFFNGVFRLLAGLRISPLDAILGLQTFLSILHGGQ